MSSSPQARIRALWSRLGSTAPGRILFSRALGRMVPYTATIRPRVEVLAPGHALVRMRDRKRVRNHLGSIHAIALANLAEVTSGLALLAGLPDHARAILVGLEIDYLRKARGTLIGESRPELPQQVTAEQEMVVQVSVRDAAGDPVVRGRARWRVGPR